MADLRVPILVVYLASGLAAATDIRRFRIANALTLSLLASGLAYHAFYGGWPGLGRGVAGAAFGFFALVVPYAAGGMGAGDVKFLAGVGAWLGLPMTSEVLLAAALAAGVYALALAVATGRLREALGDVRRLVARGGGRVEVPVQEVASREDRRRRLVPFAAMVAAGLVATTARM